MFQSTLGPADPLIGGAANGPVFRGALLRLPPQGPAAVQGLQKGLDGGGRGLDGVGVGIGVAGGSS